MSEMVTPGGARNIVSVTVQHYGSASFLLSEDQFIQKIDGYFNGGDIPIVWLISFLKANKLSLSTHNDPCDPMWSNFIQEN